MLYYIIRFKCCEDRCLVVESEYLSLIADAVPDRCNLCMCLLSFIIHLLN